MKSKKKNEIIVLAGVLIVGMAMLLIFKTNPLITYKHINSNFRQDNDTDKSIVNENEKNQIADVTEINMDTNTWINYETEFLYEANVKRKIIFKYPNELYIKDYGANNGTFILQREPIDYKYPLSASIEIGRGQLKGEFYPTESGVTTSDVIGGKYRIRKAEKSNTGDPNICYGVIYYLGNMESYTNRDVAIYLKFLQMYRQVSAEEERILKNITEEIAKSFTFIN